jgi:hypothetical protein
MALKQLVLVATGRLMGDLRIDGNYYIFVYVGIERKIN